MKTSRCMALASVLGILAILSGCARNGVEIRSAERVAIEHHNPVKGNVHIMPMKKDSLVIEVEPGVTNLDPDWATFKLRSVTAPDSEALKPSEFVTTADITKLMQDRTIQALQEAGFKVTEGDSVPGGVDVIIAPLLQAAFVSLPSPSSPSAVVRVRVNFKNTKTGLSITTLIVGYGQSLLYFTQAQGLEWAMDEAMANYQRNLIQDTKDFQGSL